MAKPPSGKWPDGNIFDKELESDGHNGRYKVSEVGTVAQKEKGNSPVMLAVTDESTSEAKHVQVWGSHTKLGMKAGDTLFAFNGKVQAHSQFGVVATYFANGAMVFPAKHEFADYAL